MRPDTPADHIAEAERLLRTAAQYPDDREPLLLRAAAHLELADERTRATPLYDELLAVDAAEPYLIKALKASNLWEYGHEAEARAIIEGIRAAGPLEPGPWQIAAETLESHDELESAHDFLSTALTLLLAPGEEVPYATQSLLIGRHRVRRLMGIDHDTWDDLTDTLHTATVPLDELHDPKRLWSLGSSDPSELQAEITRLRAELGTYRTALSRPFPVAVLHWPEPELSELLAGLPHPARRVPFPRRTPRRPGSRPPRPPLRGHPEPGHRHRHGPLVRGLRRLRSRVPVRPEPPPPVRDDARGPRPRGALASSTDGSLLVRLGAGLPGLPRGGMST